MRTVLLPVVVLVLALGCGDGSRQEAPLPSREPKPSPVRVSLEYPGPEARNVYGPLAIHVQNLSKSDLKALPDFAQALTLGQLEIAVRDARGKLLDSRAFSIPPPEAPTEKDYVVIAPSASGRLEFWLGMVVDAYDLKPGQLYFLELTLKLKGLEEPAMIRAPFGFTK